MQHWILGAWLAMSGMLMACDGEDGKTGKQTEADTDTDTDADTDTDTDTDADTTVPTPVTVGTAGACAEVCGGYDAACTDACPDLGLGQVTYGWLDWSSGFSYYENEEIKTCDESIPSSQDYNGETYEQVEVACCCTLPEVTVVEGDIAAPAACAEVCTAAGFGGCVEHQYWSAEDETGGSQLTYTRTSTGSVLYQVHACDNEPRQTYTAGSVTYDLLEIECACN